ncbi:hypothetical protein WMY93_015089 [Mugilogobius chulae]|uniref:C-type lectin domain-containing protein n=1 Tax=Mugilogobius chulae TaxID=88201 RepID=A0AAW0P326_9GOBI
MFILVKEQKTWEEAFIYCRRNHRDLAWSIDHKYLKTMAQVRAEMADTESVWVGLFYVCALESWVWVNGNYVDNEDDNWKYPGENDCSVAGAIENKWRRQVEHNSDQRQYRDYAESLNASFSPHQTTATAATVAASVYSAGTADTNEAEKDGTAWVYVS